MFIPIHLKQNQTKATPTQAWTKGDKKTMSKKYEVVLSEELQKELEVVRYSDSRCSDADTIRALIDKAYKRLPKTKREEIEIELEEKRDG